MFPSSEQELLALEERIGSVSTALSEEQFAKCLRRSMYRPVAAEVNRSVVDDIKCSICQVYSYLKDYIISSGYKIERHLNIEFCVAHFFKESTIIVSWWN